MKSYNCGVLNCGDGTCVHKVIDKKCPDCGDNLILSTKTRWVFCASPDVECEYERKATEEEIKLMRSQ